MKKNEQKTNDKQVRVTPFSEEELEHFRNIILKKKEESETEMERLYNMIKENRNPDANESAYSYHMADAGSDVYEQETLYLLYNRTRKFLKYLNAALERIDNRTYGICKATGKPISKGRLEAVPHTQLSIEAKTNRQ